MRNFAITNMAYFIVLAFFAEISNAQIVISTPSLEFTQACASPSFNTYTVSFTFSPESTLSSTNQFIIELSDGTGDFSSATTIYTSASGSIATSPATLTFAMPTTVSGEAYKLRIKSTAPVSTSTNSETFAAYYKAQDTPFSINNLISTAVYCSGGSYLLTIDNPGNESNDSPLQYPELTFEWYKETSPTTSTFVAAGTSLLVDEPGTYFVKTNYGTCTSNSFSNRVTIDEIGTEVTSSISSSLGNPFCASQGNTTLRAINGNSYQWYKNGEEISGATNQMYETDEFGDFSVNIDLGECSTSATILLENSGFVSDINVPEINTIQENETLTVTVTDNAINPEYKWYLNETLIPLATRNSYDIIETGNYKVIINQATGCLVSKEFAFVVRTQFPNVSNIPNLISPNGDQDNDTWVIPQEYTRGTDTKVVIISAQGKIVFQTNDYQNNWPQEQIDFKSINPVYYYVITTANNTTRKGSITVVR